MRAAFLLLVVLLLPLSSAYRDYSFSIDVTVNPDGSAHVSEKSVFILENQFEGQAFEYYLNQGKTTLADWQKFSKNIKYHFSGSVTNPQFTATREYALRYDAASVALEYEVTQLMFLEKMGSRITRYSLDSSVVALSGGRGELTLGNSMNLSLSLPRDAYSVRISPEPSLRDANYFLWAGPISSGWALSYERERALSDEVNEFFSDFARDFQSSYLWIFLLILALVVGLRLVKPGEK